METIYRQKAFHTLTPKQQKLKLQKDSEYEVAVQNLSNAFSQKKRAAGVTDREEGAYNQAKSKLWNDYRAWAISEGLYKEVTVEEQLSEATNLLQRQLGEVNRIRQETGSKELKLEG